MQKKSTLPNKMQIMWWSGWRVEIFFFIIFPPRQRGGAKMMIFYSVLWQQQQWVGGKLKSIKNHKLNATPRTPFFCNRNKCVEFTQQRHIIFLFFYTACCFMSSHNGNCRSKKKRGSENRVEWEYSVYIFKIILNAMALSPLHTQHHTRIFCNLCVFHEKKKKNKSMKMRKKGAQNLKPKPRHI